MPDKYGLCDTSVLVRVHSRTACQQICQCWQREILAGSVIDRISLPYSIWRVKGSVGFLSENLTSGTGTFYRKDCHERYVKPVPGLLAVKTLNKTVVYTCITGGYDALRPISQPDPNLDYVCFTDNPATHAAGWTIHPVPEDLAEFSKVKQQRLVKIRPDKYLAEYDVSLWLDANLVVSCDLQKDFISKLDLDHCPLWTKKHPQRACVYDEAKSVVKLKKDTQENVGKQVESYRRLGYPARNGLAETNIMLRRHKDPLVVKAMEIWSKELSEKSHRDQLSFDFACWKAGLKYGKFEKKDVEKLIRLERHYRKEYVVRNASPDQQVTVAMATQPYRKAQMLRAVNQLLPQCDKLCICLNGYNSVPAELPKSDKIITVLANDSNGIPDLGCDNKMYWLGDYPGYYATVDDDISYPPNYIETLRRKVDEYNR